MEEWRSVIGYEGYYDVSNFGNVRRIMSGHGAVVGKILKSHTSNGGYRMVSLCRDCKKEDRSIHSLVAEAFIGTPGGKQVNHIDGIKTNNSSENLEYLTCSENHSHAYAIGIRTQKLSRDDLAIISSMLRSRSQRYVAARFGVSRPAISYHVRRNTGGMFTTV